MHLRRYIFTGIILLVACTPQKIPADILPPSKMTEIITDLQLADAAYKLQMLPAAYKDQPQKYFMEILATHQTDSVTYNKSMLYYAENPKLLQMIYKGVEKNVTEAN